MIELPVNFDYKKDVENELIKNTGSVKHIFMDTDNNIDDSIKNISKFPPAVRNQ